MAQEIVVLGDGSWGTAMALYLNELGFSVRLWSARKENAEIIRENRENKRFLPGIRIPPEIVLTTDEQEATAGADVWFTVIPTVHLRTTLTRFKEEIRPTNLIVSLTKGLEISTNLRPSQIIETVLGTNRVVALSGPSHAEEVARGKPTSLVAAAERSEWAISVQNLLNSEQLRIYHNDDLIGVELAGGLKNVIAIAAGICDGLGFGDNAKSGLMTRGLVEMARFGVAMGADAPTFYGLAGMGDLITTCISPYGRNRLVGEKLGRGESPESIFAMKPMIAEGITTVRSVVERSQMMGIDIPIMHSVYDVLYQAKSPKQAVQRLMSRQLRRE